jgi:hypothetical protein
MSIENEKTFTQEQLNGILAADRKKAEAKVADLQAQVGQFETIKAAAAKRVTELESQVATLTTERDTARTEHANAKAMHDSEIATLKSLHAAAVEAHRGFAVSRAVTDALIASGEVFPTATAIAAREFEQLSVVELDDSGALTSITYAGEKHTDPKLAARAFLKAHPFFAMGAGGGTGAQRPSAGGFTAARDVTKVDPAELASRGWQSEPAK